MSKPDSISVVSEITCSKCGITKPSSEFHNNKRGPGGKARQCKACASEYASLMYIKHRDKCLDRVKGRSLSLREEKSEYDREYRRLNADRKRENDALYRLNNLDHIREVQRAYSKRNSSRKSAYDRARYESMREEFIARAVAAKAMRNKRSPPWLTDRDKMLILSRYKEAKWMTRRSGVRHHVDHIIPLNGKMVSGLHVPWNLRVITANHNLSKGNRVKRIQCLAIQSSALIDL